MVGKEIRSALRNHSGLILHVLAATGDEKQCGNAGQSNASPNKRGI
jgi:hypothetical protein